MLEELGWLSLEEQRRQQRLSMLFKIVNGFVVVDADQYLTPLEHTYKSRNHHSQAFVVPHSNTEYQQSSFFVCTVRDWNELPAHVIAAQSTSAFRAHLARSVGNNDVEDVINHICLN